MFALRFTSQYNQINWFNPRNGMETYVVHNPCFQDHLTNQNMPDFNYVPWLMGLPWFAQSTIDQVIFFLISKSLVSQPYDSWCLQKKVPLVAVVAPSDFLRLTLHEATNALLRRFQKRRGVLTRKRTPGTMWWELVSSNNGYSKWSHVKHTLQVVDWNIAKHQQQFNGAQSRNWLVIRNVLYHLRYFKLQHCYNIVWPKSWSMPSTSTSQAAGVPRRPAGNRCASVSAAENDQGPAASRPRAVVHQGEAKPQVFLGHDSRWPMTCRNATPT